MRTTLIAALVSLTVSAPATAATRTLAPPGNSGVSQYVETVPTAGGGRPTSTIIPAGGGGGGNRGGSGGPSALSPADQQALVRQGADGTRAAALARAGAPAKVAPAKVAHATHGGAGTRPASRSAVTAGSGPAPVTALFKALTGSASGGGLGPLLPGILVVSALGAGLLALRRRRAS